MDAYLQAGLDALGDATRMAIFQQLASGPYCGERACAQKLPVSRPAVSQHLQVLKDAGLVTDSKAGTRRLYQLNPEGVARLRAHFDQMWTQAMSRLSNRRRKIAQERNMANTVEEAVVRKSVRVQAADRARIQSVCGADGDLVAGDASHWKDSVRGDLCGAARGRALV